MQFIRVNCKNKPGPRTKKTTEQRSDYKDDIVRTSLPGGSTNTVLITSACLMVPYRERACFRSSILFAAVGRFRLIDDTRFMRYACFMYRKFSLSTLPPLRTGCAYSAFSHGTICYTPKLAEPARMLRACASRGRSEKFRGARKPQSYLSGRFLTGRRLFAPCRVGNLLISMSV